MITIEEFKKKHTNKVRLLGLDLGSKKIGVSICDENQSIATPYKTIIKSTNNDLVNNLKEIIDDNNIKGIIIGNPINMDGSLGKSAQSVKDISNNIAKLIDLRKDNIGLVIYEQVLEHIIDLDSELDLLEEIMPKGSFLYIGVFWSPPNCQYQLFIKL